MKLLDGDEKNIMVPSKKNQLADGVEVKLGQTSEAPLPYQISTCLSFL